ncbi:hypothetical protein DRO91_01700 [Candidatus Heimdallarchaeota archaeon]|nr:MAG: hypothetical protein DRO91_01700 [Candidatus Heimdallarchaeota archaeon]
MEEMNNSDSVSYIFSWNRLIRLCKMDNMDEKEKQEIIDAIMFLKNEFDNNFLLDTQDSHFLPQQLVKNSTLNRHRFLWLKWFASSYQRLKEHKSANLLIKMIKNRNASSGVLNELVYIDKFLQSNFTIELYPRRQKKKPDVAVTMYSRAFDVEITHQEPKKSITDFLNAYFFLNEPFFKNDLRRSQFDSAIVLLTPYLAKETIKSINVILDQTIRTAIKEETIISGKINHLLKYVVGHVKKREEIKKWCDENNTQINTIQLESNLLESAISSFMGKINSKMKENLRNSENSLLMITEPNLFFLNDLNGNEDFDEIVVKSMQIILDHPKLLAVILGSGLYSRPERLAHKEKNEYTLISNENDVNNSYYLIIWNNKATNILTKKEKAELCSLLARG